MDKVQLARLVQWAGDRGVQGRKRLQKVVYLLQAAGCPLDVDFILHHYGPYSRDVADVCDEMVAEGLLTEQVELSSVKQYTYTLPAATARLLEQIASTAPDRTASLDLFRGFAGELFAAPLWSLELGSTIVYYHALGEDWAGATRRACEFKKVPVEDGGTRAAADIARKVAEGKAC
jgi:hypothetical protein